VSEYQAVNEVPVIQAEDDARTGDLDLIVVYVLARGLLTLTVAWALVKGHEIIALLASD